MPYSPSPRGQIAYIRVKSTTASSPPKRRIAINSHIVTTRCLSRSSASWSRRGPSCFCMFVPDLFSAKVEPRVLSIRGRCSRSPISSCDPRCAGGLPPRAGLSRRDRCRSASPILWSRPCSSLLVGEHRLGAAGPPPERSSRRSWWERWPQGRAPKAFRGPASLLRSRWPGLSAALAWNRERRHGSLGLRLVLLRLLLLAIAAFLTFGHRLVSCDCKTPAHSRRGELRT